MQDIYANNVLGMETSLLLNYDWNLRNFYQYAQQLDMESLGKSVNQHDGAALDYQTGMIVWGVMDLDLSIHFINTSFRVTKDSNLYLISTKK